MPHRLALFAIALAGLGLVPARAQDSAEPMQTPECAAARRQLDALLAAVSPPPPGPIVITSCDATGCWDASGASYNQQGPVLLGPRGVCTRLNGLLNCP